MAVDITPNPNVVGPQGLQGTTGGTGTQGIQGPGGSSYLAPTIGSTLISSGSTVLTINGMTKIVANTHASLDANSYEQDLTLMNIMQAW
jgi:hypothetical protein